MLNVLLYLCVVSISCQHFCWFLKQLCCCVTLSVFTLLVVCRDLLSSRASSDSSLFSAKSTKCLITASFATRGACVVVDKQTSESRSLTRCRRCRCEQRFASTPTRSILSLLSLTRSAKPHCCQAVPGCLRNSRPGNSART